MYLKQNIAYSKQQGNAREGQQVQAPDVVEGRVEEDQAVVENIVPQEVMSHSHYLNYLH